MKQRVAPARGFTLLEVLIALAIVAMSVGALLGTLTSVGEQRHLSQGQDAGRMGGAQSPHGNPHRPAHADKGKRTGNTVMGGMRWEWEQEVIELPIKGMFRIDVRAHADRRDGRRHAAQSRSRPRRS